MTESRLIFVLVAITKCVAIILFCSFESDEKILFFLFTFSLAHSVSKNLNLMRDRMRNFSTLFFCDTRENKKLTSNCLTLFHIFHTLAHMHMRLSFEFLALYARHGIREHSNHSHTHTHTWPAFVMPFTILSLYVCVCVLSCCCADMVHASNWCHTTEKKN